VELVKAIKSLVPLVVDALKDTDEQVRYLAVFILGKVSKQRKGLGHLQESGSPIDLFFSSGTCQANGKCGAMHS